MILNKYRNKISKNKNENKYYINIDLSFFDDGGEKTEKATPRKKEKAREEGQVALSHEVATAILFICAFLSLKIFGGIMYDGLASIVVHDLSLVSDIDSIFNMEYITHFTTYMFSNIIFICLPVFAVIMLTGLITNVAQVGWHPTPKPIMPKFSRFNPITGFKKIISVNSVVELVKSLLKLGFVTYVIYNGLVDELPFIKNLILMNLSQAFIYIAELCVDLGIRVGIYFLIIAALDFAYQRYTHAKKLKMTKQEVKDEMRSAEGDPMVKGQIKQKMRQISMRRMMQEVPNADVIITNPTHFAVAIKYDPEKASAPIVLAKGVDHLARRIKDLAKENSVEIVENRPLARALYNTVDVGREIPPELYQAVAEVLAFVYKLKDNKYES